MNTCLTSHRLRVIALRLSKVLYAKSERSSAQPSRRGARRVDDVSRLGIGLRRGDNGGTGPDLWFTCPPITPLSRLPQAGDLLFGLEP